MYVQNSRIRLLIIDLQQKTILILLKTGFDEKILIFFLNLKC